jgi:hypothetical protein
LIMKLERLGLNHSVFFSATCHTRLRTCLAEGREDLKSWQPVVKGRRRTEGAEAPRRQGATTENTGLYLREEQRSRRGCIGGRMQPAFHHGLLGLPLR